MALALVKGRVKEHICSPDGLFEREGGGRLEDTETNQGLDHTLLESLLFAPSQPYGSSHVLYVHTNFMTTKVAPCTFEGLVGPPARLLRMMQEKGQMRGGL